MLRMYISPEMKDWEKWLVHAEFAYNNAQHKATGYSPFQLAYGRHPVTPVSLAAHGCGADHSAEDFLEEREAFRKRAAEALEVARSPDKQHLLRNSRQYAVGDKVWLSTKNLHKYGERCKKLLLKYMGPFNITKRIGTVAYKLDLPAAMSRLHPVFHVGLLAPHHPRPTGAPEDPRIFDAVPMQAETTADAAMPGELVFQSILRHRDRELEGHVVKEYLVTCR
jgi:hypothetical protein